MFYVGLGIIVFGLYVLYDVNSVLWNQRILHASFFAGTILLAGVTVWQVADAVQAGFFGNQSIIWLVFAVIFLILLIYTLFFALPFDETYIKSDSGKAIVYDKGMYAVCRHPGVLWLFLFYLCLGGAFYPSDVLKAGMFYSLLDLLYVVLQDFWTFPKTFEDYESYKKSTPFLIPTPGSIRRAFATWK